METHARFFLIGAFSLTVIAVLLVFALWLGKLELGRDYQLYDIRFHESVAGLSEGGIVQFQGVQIGEVRKLKLDPLDPREVIVRVRLDQGTPVKDDTKAQLSFTGLTGVSVIELIGGTPGAALLRESDSRDVPEIESIPSNLSKLMNGGAETMASAQKLLDKVTLLVSDENIDRVSATLANLEATSQKINSDYPKAQLALADARVAIRSAKHALSAIDGFATQSTGVMQRLDGQARGELTLTLSALHEATNNLVRITQHFDADPAKYILGSERLPVYRPTTPSK